MERIKYAFFNKTPYETHKIVFDLIPPNKIILDVGCATGYFADQLREKKCVTYGVEVDENAAFHARKFCKKVYIEDVTMFSLSKTHHRFYDYILLLDVLEHLKNPLIVLEKLKIYLKKKGKIIVSVPNFAHISVRINLLLGRFNYSEFGILDKNHIRFFTKESFLELFKIAGLRLEKLDYSADFGQIPFLGRILKRLDKKAQYLITKVFNSLLAVQFVAICRI